MAGREIIQIGIEATDDASKKLEKIAKAAEQLEKLKAEIEVEADTSAAEGDLEDVEDKAKALDKLDPEVDVTVDTGNAEGNLKSLGDQAERTDKSLRDTGEGGKLAGNSVADMAGPLGDAEGAASTAAGVFDGLGDVVEQLAPKMGLSAAATAGLVTGLGAAGFLVAGAAAAWSKYQENQRKAREEMEKTAKAQKTVNEAIAEGDIKGAAEAFLEAYPQIGEAAEDAGVSVGDLTKFIRGQTDELPGLDAAIRSATDEVNALTAAEERRFTGKGGAGTRDPAIQAAIDHRDALVDTREEVQGYREDELGASGANKQYATEIQEIEAAFQEETDQVDRAREAEKNLRDAREAAANSDIAYSDAQIDLADAHAATATAAEAAAGSIDANGVVVGEATETTRAYEDAVRAERDAAINAADAAGQLAADNAAAAGATDTATTKTNEMNDSLLYSAQNATPAVRDQIIGYIADLNGIPPEKVSEILASTPNLAEQKRLLDEAAAQREVPFKIRVLSAEAIAELNALQSRYQLGAAPRGGQYGMDTTVVRPTTFVAGEHGFPERVQITPNGAHGLAAAAVGAVDGGSAQSFNYTINLPRGTRGDDLVRTMRQHARRNGGRPQF